MSGWPDALQANDWLGRHAAYLGVASYGFFFLDALLGSLLVEGSMVSCCTKQHYPVLLLVISTTHMLVSSNNFPW